MKREIKFRAWITEECKRGYIVNQMFDDSTVKSELVSDMKFPSLFWSENGIIPMQYTGIKDKNGKEIYEGDIVLKGGRTGSVVWGSYSDGEYVSNVECWLVNVMPLSDLGGLWGASEHTNEVIGNIYEHPELLK